MGIFGPSQQEKIASHPIVGAANWRRHMQPPIPEYRELVESALHLAERGDGDVDVAAMLRRAHAGTEAVLKQLCTKLQTLSWTDVQIVLGRPDYSSALLTDYLSTCGAQGVAAANKLAQLMADTIPRMLADEVRGGSFDRDTDGSAHLARVIGAAGSTPPAGDATTRLPNPGLPDDDPRQLAYGLFKASGLTILAFGNLALDQLAEQLLRQAPAFGDTEVKPVGVGCLAGRGDRMWLGFDGPEGSLIAYFATGDVDFVQRDVLTPMSALPAPARWGVGTVGALVPQEAARILAAAQFTPLWELPRFSHQRPADELTVPSLLAAGLAAESWEEVGSAGFKTDVAVADERTVAVFFGPYDGQSFALMTPLDKDDNVPAHVRGRSFGNYALGVVADMAVLYLRYPAEALPPASDLTTQARALAQYTHGQFGQAQPLPNVTPSAGHFAPRQSPVPPPNAGPMGSSGVGATLPPRVTPVSASALSSPAPATTTSAARSSPSWSTTSSAIGATTPGYGTGGPASSAPSVRLMLAIAVAVVVAVAGVIMLMRPDGRSSAPTSSGSPVSVGSVSPCSTPPTLRPQSTTVGASGLVVSTIISPGCSTGDLLSNDDFRVTATDASGHAVASGIFDLSATPIAVSGSGTSVEMTFPAGTYWRTAESISGPLTLTAHPEGADTRIDSGAAGATTIVAKGAGAPESGDLDAAASSALVDIAAADRTYIDANLLDTWQPQLSSKRPGLFADGINWSASEIVREHMELRQRFPGARLVWSGDWPVYGDPEWWVTLAGVSFGSGEDANAWCQSQGFDPDHCFAKILSHSQGSSGTTLSRK